MFPNMSFFLDYSTVIRAASRLVASAPRWSQACRQCPHACHQHRQMCHGHSQTYCWHSQTCRLRSQTCHQCSQVFPGAPKVLSGTLRFTQSYHNYSHGTATPVFKDRSYSKGWQESPPPVEYSAEIDASTFTLHILSDTPGGFQRLKYILLMCMMWFCNSIYMIQTSCPSSITTGMVWSCPGMKVIMRTEWVKSRM
jgi:hypothetical protein